MSMFNQNLFNDKIKFTSMIIVHNFSNQSKTSSHIFIHFNTLNSFSLSNYLFIQRIIFLTLQNRAFSSSIMIEILFINKFEQKSSRSNLQK